MRGDFGQPALYAFGTAPSVSARAGPDRLSPVSLGGGTVDGRLGVSVVVPSRGRGGELRRAIEAVLDDPAVVEVIVVIDGPAGAHEASPLLADLPTRTPIRVLVGDGGGASRARALGAAHASGDIVLFLDDDVIAGPGLAGAHAAHHRRRRRLVVVGSMPVADHLLKRSAAARIYAADYQRVCGTYEASNDAVLLDLWTGNISIRRDDCMRVGMASDAFPYAQHEDREFGLRCRDGGLTGLFDPNLVATHHYVRSPRAFLDLARRQVMATWAMHALHNDTLGPWDPEQYRSGVGPRLRWLVGPAGPSQNPNEGGLKVTTLRVAGHAARLAGSRRFEQRALTLSRAVVQHAMARQLLSAELAARASAAEIRGPDQPATSDAIPATIITNPRAT